MLASLSLVFAPGSARASVDSVPGFDDSGLFLKLDQDQNQSFKLPPEIAFLRTQSVLRHFEVPEEPDSQPALDYLNGRQNLQGVKTVLPFMDPKATLRRFIREPGESFEAYQDLDARQVADFQVELAQGAPEAPAEPESFHQRLLEARSNPASKPLAGLRIALDPGHMGGAFWDARTGKHVHDGHGHALSEGVLNLQVTLLLEKAFRDLGADVLVTHHNLGPVSQTDFAKMDLRPYALNELRENTLAPWFQNLLASGEADSDELFSSFDSNPAVKGVFARTDANRDKFFILREDLIARSDAINEFRADIALVIHFDTSDPPNDSSGLNPAHYDGTKVYVVGSYDAAELSSREARSYFARHLLDATSWDASLKLGRSVVDHLKTGLGIKFDTFGGGSSLEVEPGVFARNLGVSRRVTDRALTYVECLYYNDPAEFSALYDAHHPLKIDGEDHPYSDRLAQVADSIQAGVVSFVRGYGD